MNNQYGVIDIKSGSKIYPSAGIQLIAYLSADEFHSHAGDAKRWVVHLKSNGTYELIEFTNKSDLYVWDSALIIHDFIKGAKR